MSVPITLFLNIDNLRNRHKINQSLDFDSIWHFTNNAFLAYLGW